MVPLEEQETIITIDYDTKQAFVYSSKKSMVQYLQKIAEENSDVVKIIGKTEDAIDIRVPMNWIPKVRPKRKRVMTEEQRAHLIEIASIARKNKENKQ